MANTNSTQQVHREQIYLGSPKIIHSRMNPERKEKGIVNLHERVGEVIEIWFKNWKTIVRSHALLRNVSLNGEKL
jgi:hypothetical protein